MSSKPKKPKPSEESPTSLPNAKKPRVGKPKKSVVPVYVLSPTQGHSKAQQRLEDLWQNEQFRTDLAKIQRIPDWHKRSKRLFEFAEDNSLDLFFGSPFLQLLMNEKPWPQDPHLDLCQIIDEADELLNDPDHEYWVKQPRPHPDHRLSIMLYPVHICVSPLATKRDALDYVAKRWGEIHDLLEGRRRREPAIRTSPKAARDQFIWEHREVPSSELADMVCDRFPGQSLTYADINSIKQKLKKPHFIL